MKTRYIKPTTEVVFPVTEEFMLSATVNNKDGSTDSYMKPGGNTSGTGNTGSGSVVIGGGAKHFNAWETWD